MELTCTYQTRVTAAKRLISKVSAKYPSVDINLGTICNFAGRTYGRTYKKQLAKYLQNRIKAAQIQA